MISEDVRRYAEDPAAWPAAEFPPAGGLERVLTERYCALFGPVSSFTAISRLRLDPNTFTETLAEVRALVAERGHRDAAWWVSSSATPDDLLDLLLSHGLAPATRPGLEPHATAMALVEEPPPPPNGVEGRAVETFEDFTVANRIAAEAFGVPAEQQAEWDAVARERWEAARRAGVPVTFLARVDGEPAGIARSVYSDRGVFLIAGSVLERFRGRGVYRALVRARWDDAVRRGTPALVTEALPDTSYPILLRLGFVDVGTTRRLEDPRG